MLLIHHSWCFALHSEYSISGSYPINNRTKLTGGPSWIVCSLLPQFSESMSHFQTCLSNVMTGFACEQELNNYYWEGKILQQGNIFRVLYSHSFKRRLPIALIWRHCLCGTKTKAFKFNLQSKLSVPIKWSWNGECHIQLQQISLCFQYPSAIKDWLFGFGRWILFIRRSIFLLRMPHKF